MPPTTCRVFISYAHDDEPHKAIALEYSNWLNEHGGLDCWIDRYMEDVDMPEGWPAWMRNQIDEARYVIVVCSPKYLARFNRNSEEEGKGKGVKWESTLMENHLYQNDGLNDKFIPVIFQEAHVSYIPQPLQNSTYFDLSNEERKKSLYRRLTNQPAHAKPRVGSVIDLSISAATAELELVPVPVPVIEASTLIELFNMKAGTKLMQKFFSLSNTKRFSIATKLGLVLEGETFESSTDKTYSDFLMRAYHQKRLEFLWSELFNETIDPNPFK